MMMKPLPERNTGIRRNRVGEKMQLTDVYELIPWSVLKEWAARVKFDESIIRPSFPKYRDRSKKAVFADYLMDHVDEGFNFANVSYPKADPIKGADLAGSELLEVYKLYFDSSRAEEEQPGSVFLAQWEKRLEESADRLKEKYGNK